MGKADLVANVVVHVVNYLGIVGVVACLYECGTSDAGLSWHCLWSNYTLYMETLFSSCIHLYETLVCHVLWLMSHGVWRAVYDLMAGTFRYVMGV